MEYTKGEWFVEYYNSKGDEGYLILAQEDEQTQGLIADCPPYSDNPPVGKANAHLIASAPDLLEALSHIIFMSKGPKEYKNEHQPQYWVPESAIKHAQEAIQKARG